jgi:hypothetical protein
VRDHSVARLLVMTAALVGFGTTGWWSLRTGWADYWVQQETLAGTERALAAMPIQPAYHIRLATQVSDQDPQRESKELRLALVLNPLDAGSWIELGLRAERRGENSGAEASLLRAASADRTYLPRWSLANFYFRHDNSERFWFWVKAAAEMAPGDPAPLFRLCGMMAEDGRLMERLAIRDPQLTSGYLAYLLRAQRLDLIGPATRQLLNERREANVPLLLEACERLIESGQRDEAVEIWNGLAPERRAAIGNLHPLGGTVLTNGDFAQPPTSRGFDWRLPEAAGIGISREENPAGLRVTFSGTQAEQTEALTQFAPTNEGSDYQLLYRYQTLGLAAGSGLAWRIAALDGTVLAVGKSLSSEEESTARLNFRTPIGCPLVRLALSYRRTPGTTRIEGQVRLREVVLVRER